MPPPVPAGLIVVVTPAGQRTVPAVRSTVNWSLASRPAGAVAHHLADVQDDPRDELTWDLRALQAADDLTSEALLRAGATASIAGLYPSLHLNLGEDYRKLGDLPAARRHLQLGQQASPALGNDGYSQMIRRGLDGLAARLETDERGAPQ